VNLSDKFFGAIVGDEFEKIENLPEKNDIAQLQL
jgi:hypothetical protein